MRKQVLEKTKKRVREVLDSHQPTPLSEGKVGEMKTILKKVGLEKITSMI